MWGSKNRLKASRKAITAAKTSPPPLLSGTCFIRTLLHSFSCPCLFLLLLFKLAVSASSLSESIVPNLTDLLWWHSTCKPWVPLFPLPELQNRKFNYLSSSWIFTVSMNESYTPSCKKKRLMRPMVQTMVKAVKITRRVPASIFAFPWNCQYTSKLPNTALQKCM